MPQQKIIKMSSILKLSPGEYIIGDLYKILPNQFCDDVVQQVRENVKLQKQVSKDSTRSRKITKFNNIPKHILSIGETNKFFIDKTPFLHKISAGTVIKKNPMYYNPRGDLVVPEDHIATKNYNILFSINLCSEQKPPIAIIPVDLLLDQLGYEDRNLLSDYSLSNYGKHFVSKNGISISTL